jgi:hypothetical protein
MPGPRLVAAALRCYPRPWRRRHGAEAAELAVLLIRDGIPARSIAWNYLQGAARERLIPKPGHRLAAAAVALMAAAGSLGIPLALLSTSAPASAASAVHRPTARQSSSVVRRKPLPLCGDPFGVLSPAAVSIRVAPDRTPADGHGQRC